eukprot:2129728-Prymnesium_polylepis.1
MLTSPCSAHVGSSSPSSSRPSARRSTSRAAFRAGDARSFIVHVGMNRRRRSAARASTRPALSMSSATSSSDERKAVACASEVFDLSALRSSALISSLPLTRRERSWPR